MDQDLRETLLDLKKSIRDEIIKLEGKLEMLFRSDKDQDKAIAGIESDIKNHLRTFDSWQRDEKTAGQGQARRIDLIERRFENLYWKLAGLISLALGASTGIQVLVKMLKG